MRRQACAELLQWALPQLGFSYDGFRKVKRQVCKRIERRMRELGVNDLASYRHHLETDAEEWSRLDGMCRITISRFWRDRGVFEALRDVVLPALAQDACLEALSLGCASGEEPYSLVLAWLFGRPSSFVNIGVNVTACDADGALLERARRARYAPATLRELPSAWRDIAFRADRLLAPFRDYVRFVELDIRETLPSGPFDVVMCRNLAFTYFDAAGRARMLDRLRVVTRAGGALVVGTHEHIDAPGWEAWPGARAIYRRL